MAEYERPHGWMGKHALGVQLHEGFVDLKKDRTHTEIVSREKARRMVAAAECLRENGLHGVVVETEEAETPDRVKVRITVEKKTLLADFWSEVRHHGPRQEWDIPEETHHHAH